MKVINMSNKTTATGQEKTVTDEKMAIFLVVMSLDELVARFPLEGFAEQGDKTCKCLQFEDKGVCRHLRALKALRLAKRDLKI